MIPRVKPEGMLVRKPHHTPDQVRGRLFRDHALRDGPSFEKMPSDLLAGGFPYTLGAEDVVERRLYSIAIFVPVDPFKSRLRWKLAS